jgi:hypothetical protein
MLGARPISSEFIGTVNLYAIMLAVRQQDAVHACMKADALPIVWASVLKF